MTIMFHLNFRDTANHYTWVPEYLQIIKGTLGLSLAQFNRVCVLRFDLRFPESSQYSDPKVISRFIDSFKAHLKSWDRHRASEHPIGFGYVWCREKETSQNWHYHVAFLFNKDAVCGFGQTVFGRSNTYNRILKAWASAIGVPVDNAIGLVHVCENGVYWLDRNSDEFPLQYQAVMQRCSYLAKAATKDIYDGCRNIGSSQQLFMG
ncbi:inovirus Gp2 family protein [Shewanella algae]|uniref:inovirus Gp2 family protein n=1 Tax=Shewanella algae TaxID=38313 RepID=UPI00287F7290|nr:inovirus Gp2 family protein [Shewanella algae]